MTKKRIATMATCIALVGAVAVGGTLALLSTKSNDVTNTFTVGQGYEDGDLFLREHDVTQVLNTQTNYGGYVSKGGENWKADEGGKYTGIQYTNIVKGTTIDKDPQFGLTADAPTSWIVAKLDLGEGFATKLAINAVETAGVAGDWYRYEPEAGEGEKYVKVDGVDDIVDGKYYIFDTPITANSSTDPLFKQLRVLDVSSTPNAITVKGAAVEAIDDNFAGARDAVMAAAIGTIK